MFSALTSGAHGHPLSHVSGLWFQQFFGGLRSEHLTSLPSSFWGPLLDPPLLIEVKGSVTTLSFCGG